MYRSAQLVALLLAVGVDRAVSRMSDGQPAIADIGYVPFNFKPHKIVTHSEREAFSDRTYHYDTIDPKSGAPDIFTIRVTGGAQFNDIESDPTDSVHESIASLLDDTDLSHLDDRATPRQWICTFTVGCYRAAASFGGRVYSISINQANAVAAAVSDWVDNGSVWSKYTAKQVVTYTVQVAAGTTVYYISTKIQKQETGATDTCKCWSKEAVREACSDGVKQFTYASSQSIQAGNAEGKTYKHQAETTDNQLEGEAFIQAINVSPQQNSATQPLNC